LKVADAAIVVVAKHYAAAAAGRSGIACGENSRALKHSPLRSTATSCGSITLPLNSCKTTRRQTMERERYEFVCDKWKEGREAIFVNNPATGEGGEVVECQEELMVVRTAEGQEKSWRYEEVEETLSRRGIFPYR
jgi:hypothetical protein